MRDKEGENGKILRDVSYGRRVCNEKTLLYITLVPM